MLCGMPPEEIDSRASASIHHLGLASRIVAPALATAAVAGVVPAFAAADVWWQRVDGGPVPIGLCRAPDARPVANPHAAATALAGGVIADVVAPVVTAFAETARVSRIVLWGNVASALAGAASMLRRSGETLGHDPVEIVGALFSQP